MRGRRGRSKRGWRRQVRTKGGGEERTLNEFV